MSAYIYLYLILSLRSNVAGGATQSPPTPGLWSAPASRWPPSSPSASSCSGAHHPVIIIASITHNNDVTQSWVNEWPYHHNTGCSTTWTTSGYPPPRLSSPTRSGNWSIFKETRDMKIFCSREIMFWHQRDSDRWGNYKYHNFTKVSGLIYFIII